MKSFIVLGFLLAATAFAFWFVWMNRASEKILMSTLPIATGAILTVFLAGWVFGGESDYDTKFPVCYMIDLESKLPLDSIEEINKFGADRSMIFRMHRFSNGPSAVPLLKPRRPDLFSDTTKNDFCRNIYHHLLQRSLIDFLAQLYRASWRAEPLRIAVGSIRLEMYGRIPERDAPSRQTLLKTEDIERVLAGNWFATVRVWPSEQLSLPPDTTLTVQVPAGGTDALNKGEIRLRNRFCTITLSTEPAFAVRSIGEYRRMAFLSDTEASNLATNAYLLKANIHYSRLRSGHPEMKVYKDWAAQLVEQIRNEFDEEAIWVRVKEDEMRSRLYTPEQRPDGTIGRSRQPARSGVQTKKKRPIDSKAGPASQ